MRRGSHSKGLSSEVGGRQQACEDGAPSDFASALLHLGTLSSWLGSRFDQERGTSCRVKPPAPMAPSKSVPLWQMTAVPAAWPLETVLDAWVHTARLRYFWNAADSQKSLDLLKQRAAELWEPKAEPVLAAKLFQRGRAELQRCYVHYFTNEGLARVNGVCCISSWDWLEAASQRLAQRLTAAEHSAAEEAKKRRRVEEGKSAAHEPQKAKEEAARLAGCLQEAWDSLIVLLSLGELDLFCLAA